VRRGRLAKAEQFFEAADMVDALADGERDLSDAYVTLCVHAGIAAADVICCARLGYHARGESHDEARALLAKVDTDSAHALAALLGMKTKAGYSAIPAGAADRRRAGRSAHKLLERARLVG
jgi:hypothetical protein